MDIRRFYVNENDIVGDTVTLSGNEFLHMTKVLRHKVGYKIIVCNNADGIDYHATISDIQRDYAIAKIYDRVENECKTAVDIILYQANPKGDKMDLIVQKAVELGVGSIAVFNSTYVAETKFNLDRLERISVEACKQCGRSRVAKVRGLLSYSELLAELSGYDLVIVASELEKQCTLKEVLSEHKAQKIALIVGSEGGFDSREIDDIKGAGGLSVTLGKRILRCETASIVMVALAMYELGEMT